MRDLVTLELQVGDEYGNSQGYLGALHVSNDAGGLELESPGYPSSGPSFAHLDAATIRIGRKRFSMLGHRSHVGNWCWDAVSMTRDEALAVVRHVMKSGFSCVAATYRPEAEDFLRAANEWDAPWCQKARQSS